jgi:hypothetical protein
MSVRLELIEEVEALHSIAERWQVLADEAGISPLFRGSRWLLSWWRAYQRQLGAEIYSFAIYDDDRLVGLAPCYRRRAKRSATRKVEEIRLIGDAGPRPPALGLLAEPGYEEQVGHAVADFLAARADQWDVVELQPLDDPSATRAHMVNRLSTHGRPMDSSSAGFSQRIELQAPGVATESQGFDSRASAYVGDAERTGSATATLKTRVGQSGRGESLH